MDQLQCLGILQTCEVLKVGMPTRVTYTELKEVSFRRERILFDAVYRDVMRAASVRKRVCLFYHGRYFVICCGVICLGYEFGWMVYG